VRNTALTHLVDGDQRTVQLGIVGRSDGAVTVHVPGSRAVLPPGPYMLFVNKKTAKGLVPSTARQFTLN
jgi:galactose oxidase-like protein